MGRQNIVLIPKQRIQAELAAVAPAAPSLRPAGSFQLPLECRHVLPIKLHSSPPVVRSDKRVDSWKVVVFGFYLDSGDLLL